jgi:hypothetical protein
MDDETISTFNTVCTAGYACEGFNGETNERLRQLADVGLLVVAQAPSFLARRHAYTPTNKGWELFKRLVNAGKTRAQGTSGT